MNLHIVKSRKQPKNGKPYEFYILRRNVYVPESQSVRSEYLAYIGNSLVISEERAREIAKKASERAGEKISITDLRRVNRLEITNGSESGSSKSNSDDLVKVRTLEQVAYHGIRAPGAVLDVEREIAEQWTMHGLAEFVDGENRT